MEALEGNLGNDEDSLDNRLREIGTPRGRRFGFDPLLLKTEYNDGDSEEQASNYMGLKLNGRMFGNGISLRLHASSDVL